MTATAHSAHDFPLLMRRWQRLIRRSRLSGVPLGEAEGLPVWGLESAAAASGEPALYLSAGVHGDEPAGPWALLEWAENNAKLLRAAAVMLVPCFNPVGFSQNTRADGEGVDMNRQFHDLKAPLMKPWQSWIKTRQLALGLSLHEDYDALGCYVYELSSQKSCLGEMLLAHTEAVMPRDPRKTIDGHPARAGLIRRPKIPTGFSGPEAIVLAQLGCPVTLTFETASELGIEVRVDAQMVAISAALEACAR